MRLGTKSIEVPVLSDALIKLADLCARELWIGIDYQSGKKQEFNFKNKLDSDGETITSPLLSDERLLEMFAIPFYSHARLYGLKQKVPLPFMTIDPFFIKVAGLTQSPKLKDQDLGNGINTLLTVIAKDYKDYITGKSDQDSLTKTIQYTSRLVKEFGLTDKINRRALTFRILFFAIPDFPCFNFGDSISSSLKLKVSDENLIENYVNTLERGYKLNWSKLSQYEMPLPNHLDSNIWMHVKAHGWWQRRIYDLALLMYFSQNNSKGKKSITLSPRVVKMFHSNCVPYA
jgi:hypothetical protein